MTESTIRFAVEKGFFVCENEIFDIPLNPIDKLTYIALVRYCDTQQRAWPSYIRLSSDVGVGKKRAIQAVKNLIVCRLLEKKARGNRSNVYLVYPARFFCSRKKLESEEQKIDNNGVHKTLQDNIEVSQEHPQGVLGTPSECRTNTLRVSQEHPTNTNTNNNTNTLSSPGKEREKISIKTKERTEGPLDIIKELILKKGYQVNERVINDMLSQYTAEEVSAAIKCTDFKRARNPLAVVFALLQTGRYVIPSARRPIDNIDNQCLEAVDKITLQEYLQQVKNTLKIAGGVENA